MPLGDYAKIINRLSSTGKPNSFGDQSQITITTHVTQIDKVLSQISPDTISPMLSGNLKNAESRLNDRLSRKQKSMESEQKFQASRFKSERLDQLVEGELRNLTRAMMRRKNQIQELQDNDGYEQAARDEVAKQFMETAEWLKFKQQGGDKVIALINQGNYAEAAKLAAYLETDIVIFSVSNAVPAGKSVKEFKEAYILAKSQSKGSLGTTRKMIENGFASIEKDIKSKINTLKANHEMEKGIINTTAKGENLNVFQEEYAKERIKEELLKKPAEAIKDTAIDKAKEAAIDKANQAASDQIGLPPPQ
jgi:hypothetical protein